MNAPPGDLLPYILDTVQAMRAKDLQPKYIVVGYRTWRRLCAEAGPLLVAPSSSEATMIYGLTVVRAYGALLDFLTLGE
jgi:hypothetical protein